MSLFRKYFQSILAFIILIALVFGIALFYFIPYLTPFVNTYILPNETLSMTVAIFIGIAVVYFVVAFIYALFARAKNRILRLKNEQGEILIESETVEMVVLDAIHNISNAQNKKVNVKLGFKPEQTKVSVSFAIDQNQDAAAVSNEMQTRIKNRLEQYFGQPIQSVNVKAQPYDATENAINESAQTQRVR